jgi:hypothetical protein
MANTIRLKRASGSDPGSSDLVTGEIAVRTDTGKLFTKKDDGSVAEISGGGIDDGDKGDITVSNSGATFTIDNDAVTYAKIQNVSATNRILGRDSSGAGNIEEITPANLRTMINVEDGATADQTAAEIKTLLNSNGIVNAQIDASAAIAGTKISPSFTSDLTISNTSPKIFLTDTNDNDDFSIRNENGTFKIYDETNSAGRFKVLSSGTVQVTGNLDVDAGLDVTGNISCTGTVDGRDVATDGSKLDGIESGATADQSNSEIKTAYEANSDTNAFTDALLSKLNGIAASATNVTNTNQLTNGAGFITATLTNEQVQDIVGGMLTGNTETGITVTYQDGDGTIDFVVGTLNQDTTGNAATATALETARTIAGVSFDGSANISLNNNAITNGAGYITSADGGNAATLDSLDSTSFLRSDAADSASGDITFGGGAGAATIGAASDISFTNGDWSGNHTKIQHHSNALYIVGGSSGIRFRESGTDRIFIDGSGHFVPASDSTYNIGSSSDRFANGYFDTLYGDGSNLTNISATVAGGAVYENAQSITSNYTVTNGKNAMSAGPISIASGVTVTVGSGETYTIV